MGPKNRKPILLTLAGDDVFDPFHSPCSFFLPYHRRMVRDARGIVTPAQFLVKTLESAFGADPSLIRVIPWGVDTDRYSPGAGREVFRKAYDIPSDAFVVV